MDRRHCGIGRGGIRGSGFRIPSPWGLHSVYCVVVLGIDHPLRNHRWRVGAAPFAMVMLLIGRHCAKGFSICQDMHAATKIIDVRFAQSVVRGACSLRFIYLSEYSEGIRCLSLTRPVLQLANHIAIISLLSDAPEARFFSQQEERIHAYCGQRKIQQGGRTYQKS